MLAAQRRVFASVFPTSSTTTTVPTPVATPILGFAGEGQSFGGPQIPISSDSTSPSDSAAEQVRWNRAWHTATTFLKLPEEQITSNLANLEESQLRGHWMKQYGADVLEAVSYLLSSTSQEHSAFTGNQQDGDLVAWYTNEVRRHFLTYVRPVVIQYLQADGNPGDTLTTFLRTLQVAQAIYLYPLDNHILSTLETASRVELRFRGDLHSIIAYSLPQQTISSLLGRVLTTEGSIVLGSASVNGEENTYAIHKAKERTLKYVRGFQSVGLGGDAAQRVFADVMNNLMTEYVKTRYAGQWESPSSVTDSLRLWTEDCYARFVVEVLECLKSSEYGDDTSMDMYGVSLSEVGKWQEMGINRLGSLRVNELFNIVVDWDASKGAVEDLKQYITTPVARTHLTSSFSSVLSYRLLQPGASTIEILQVYISIIRVFGTLDPKGVLLDRVARPIRRYLRDREDTVKVIVEGLLSDAEDVEGQPVGPGGDTLVELAIELNRATELAARDNDDAELDWDDMNWVPDPVDAGPDYKKSKNSDVIGSLISLFDTRDIFVKEFQDIMGERLLKKDFDFEKEIRVLELLKLRFGEGPLQACEVMLRDVLDSKRVDTVIRNDQSFSTSSKTQEAPDLHAKILSRLFWPALHEESFSIPPAVVELQKSYEKGFETLKQSRKLTWLNALGQVTVELDLEDRVVTEEVQTWQASVIYAFNDPKDCPLRAATTTVEQLTEELGMDESLVRNALTFWVGKLVLKEITHDTFQVLEVLDDSETGDHTAQAAVAAAAEAATSAAAPSVRSAEDVAMEKMQVYWQFIQGMLTNQGAMPLQRIIMMLKFAVPGGFPFNNEELKEFLDKMVSEGHLDFAAGNYKIVH
ncbi:MAG: hypothetical protein M1830_010102 [Pleopsidium flavum]|nr:MAG: hypothetical protein M1830_010102 [Pleopsidium flavum]